MDPEQMLEIDPERADEGVMMTAPYIGLWFHNSCLRSNQRLR
jgi:hypothetical protein